ncbi:MAG: hypothetical protein AABX00_00990 [Nanoarchaeota archaeon]
MKTDPVVERHMANHVKKNDIHYSHFLAVGAAAALVIGAIKYDIDRFDSLPKECISGRVTAVEKKHIAGRSIDSPGWDVDILHFDGLEKTVSMPRAGNVEVRNGDLVTVIAARKEGNPNLIGIKYVFSCPQPSNYSK